jgi:hypothetical protein
MARRLRLLRLSWLRKAQRCSEAGKYLPPTTVGSLARCASFAGSLINSVGIIKVKIAVGEIGLT